MVAVQVAFGETRAVRQGPDVDHLFERVSESAFVVRGRALDVEPVGRREYFPAKQVGANTWQGDARNLEGGRMFTVEVAEIICRQGDLAPAPLTPEASPDVVRVFLVPSREPQGGPSKFSRTRGTRPEFLVPGLEYLLFLYEPPGQDRLVKEYRLEPGVTYYRTVEGDLGAIELPSAGRPERPRSFATEMVKAVTTFCEAMKGPDAATKIRQLQGVQDTFNYPAWRRSVDQAVRALQEQRRPAQ